MGCGNGKVTSRAARKKQETPAGAVDDSNATYTLSYTPVPNSLQLLFNGLRQREGAENDYTISGRTITMADPLEVGDSLFADYLY